MLGDAMSSHTVLPGYETIPYIARDRTAIADEEHIDGWLPAQAVSVGRHQTTDYDYTKPRADLSSQKVDPRGHDHDSFASFEWPGGYRDDAPGAHYSRVRLEEQQAEHERASADTDVRGVAPGYLFTLEHCPRADQNREYLIVRCQYRFQENAYASDQRGGRRASDDDARAAVEPALPVAARDAAASHQRAADGHRRRAAREEIWTDQYGRVKLQFRWDRYGQSNQDSSCWVRVSSPWAGGGFGACRFRGWVMRSSWIFSMAIRMSRSSPGGFSTARRCRRGAAGQCDAERAVVAVVAGGTTDHANAFRFEDKKGAEQLWMHAERNFDAETEPIIRFPSGTTIRIRSGTTKRCR